MIAPGRSISEVLGFSLLWRDAQCLGTGLQQTDRAFGAGGAGVNTVDGDAEFPNLDGQSLGQVDQRYVAGPAAQVASVPGVAATDVDDPPKRWTASVCSIPKITPRRSS